MNLPSRSELRRAILAQLENQSSGRVINVELIVSVFVEQLIALRDSYEQSVARFMAGLEVELAAARRELSDLRAELIARERRPSNVQNLDRRTR
jgi:hypothetical protein